MLHTIKRALAILNGSARVEQSLILYSQTFEDVIRHLHAELLNHKLQIQTLQQVVALLASLDESDPPQYFTSRIQAINSHLDAIRTEIKQLEQRQQERSRRLCQRLQYLESAQGDLRSCLHRMSRESSFRQHETRQLAGQLQQQLIRLHCQLRTRTVIAALCYTALAATLFYRS